MGFRKGRLVSPEKFNKITKVTVIALVILCIIYWSFVYHLGMQQYQKALNIAADPVAIQADLSVEETIEMKNKKFLFKMIYSFEVNGKLYTGKHREKLATNKPSELPTTISVWASSKNTDLHETEAWVAKNSQPETYTRLIPTALFGAIVICFLLYFLITRRFFKLDTSKK